MYLAKVGVVALSGVVAYSVCNIVFKWTKKSPQSIEDDDLIV